MKHILVGVDESGRSDEAVLVGLDLARRCEAKLELVHGVHVPSGHWPGLGRAKSDAENAQAVTAARAAISGHLRTRRSEGQPLKLGATPIEELLSIVPAHPAKALLDRAGSMDAALIVLGSHRRRKVIDFGGTLRAVLAKSECPVWVQNGWARPVQHVLAPVDLSEHSLAALGTARDIAKKYGARITAFYCFVNPGYYYSLDTGAPMAAAIERVEELRGLARAEFERKMEHYDWQGVPHETIFIEDDPVQGILAHQDACDLIVMGTHGVTGFTATVLGSVAYGVLRSAHTPVLVQPRPDRPFQL